VLNDFGAGLSSLSMLKKMPIEMVKLDRSLVADYAQEGHFIRAITALAHELGISVIADGVDNAQQRDSLAALGIDYVQGEFISPPVDGATLTSMLEGSNIRLL
jgi:EAL domain-containing protein (putative c-di-GMP-specific phosphodiesterase class I)